MARSPRRRARTAGRGDSHEDRSVGARGTRPPFVARCRERIGAWWRARRPRRWPDLVPEKTFRTDLVIGGVIFAFLFVLHELHLIGRLEDLGAGAFMPLYRSLGISDDSTAFVFVDIDESAYRKWGMQPWVPRDKLATLIERAASAEPQLIVVDVDLSYPYCGRGRLAKGVKTNAGLVSDVKAILDEHPDLHVILMQSSAAVSDVSTVANHSLRCVGGFAAPEQPRLHWVVPTVRADVDLVVRDWPLGAPRLEEQNEPAASLGVGPISRAVRLLHRGPVRPGEEDCLPHADRYREELTRLRAAASAREALGTPQRPGSEELIRARATSAAFDELADCLSGDFDREASMIAFTIPWDLEDGEAWPALPNGTRLLTRVSAGLLAQPGEVEPLSGRIVVIGGSYLDSRDHHLTPIGVMPGAMVLINAIHSHLEFGAVRAPAPWEHLLIGVVEIVVAAWAFSRLHLGFATLVTVLFVFGMTVLWGYYRLWSGVWVDVTLPVLGIMAHHILGLTESARERSRSGLSSLLLREHDHGEATREPGGPGHGRGKHASGKQQ